MTVWLYLSGVVSLIAALGLCLVVLNQGVREGVIIKAGLIGMIFSLLSTFALVMNGNLDMEYYSRAGLVLRASIVVVCLGLLVRARGYAKRLREEIDIPCDDHARRTRGIIGKIAEPARDLALLLSADSAPAPLEPDSKQEKQR